MSSPGGPRAAILLYHRVASVATDPWRLSVEPDRFREHLDVIASSFRALPLGELVQSVREKTVPPGAVALTFDDGYRDNLYAAKPLLEDYWVPATVFVVSGYVDSKREFWWDELERICREQAAANEDFDSIHREFHRKLQALRVDERHAILDSMAASASADDDGGPLTMDELILLAAGDLVGIGAHTVTHRALSNLGRAEQLEELRASKRQLENAVSQPVEGVSYPYGDYGAETADCAREGGFAYACTSTSRPFVAADDPFELPRLHVENWHGDELERRLSEWLRPADERRRRPRETY